MALLETQTPPATPASADITGLAPVEATFATFDGVELFYRHWHPPAATDRAVLLFHRGHEHSGRFQDLVERLGLTDCHVFAWDARGHGRSPGDRGYAESFAVVVKDVDAFVRFIAGKHGIPVRNMVVLGHSVGAVAVAAWVHDYAPPVRAMVLATPALRVKLYVPFDIADLHVVMEHYRQKTAFSDRA